MTETKRKTSRKQGCYRRKHTLKYFLPKENILIPVCKKLFLNTLSISDRTIRTVMSKITESGVVEKEKRGGRPKALKIRDIAVRQAIKEHINRYPRMESHYCRSSTSKEYLHPDLSLYKMVDMFNHENKNKGTTTSYYTYWNEFRFSSS